MRGGTSAGGGPQGNPDTKAGPSLPHLSTPAAGSEGKRLSLTAVRSGTRRWFRTRWRHWRIALLACTAAQPCEYSLATDTRKSPRRRGARTGTGPSCRDLLTVGPDRQPGEKDREYS